MKFVLKTILGEINQLYLQPATLDRFNKYINKLQGDTKGDMTLPIAGFNPMAKEHMLDKISELEALQAEKIMEETIHAFNKDLGEESDRHISVVLNIADDLAGAWTHFYTTDFDSKFKLNAFVSRDFCVPYFWTSESYTEALIHERTQAYLLRTQYWIQHGKPIKLADYFQQESFVCSKLSKNTPTQETDVFSDLISHYNTHRNSEDYNLIFNFFYGDKGSRSLGFKEFGVQGQTGYDLAEHLAIKEPSSVEPT